MSFWSWWSRKPATAVPVQRVPERRPNFSDADLEFVRAALDRFEASGLSSGQYSIAISSSRALIDSDRRKRVGELCEDGLLMLFLALASGTDSLTYYVDEMEELFTPLSRMDEDAADTMLQEHSFSIFVNANSIGTVNEDDSLDGMVHALAALTGGTLDITNVSQQVTKNGLTKLSFHVEDVGERNFEVENRKRPDITPVLVELNRITKSKGLGQFVAAGEGDSDSETFIFATDDILVKITNLLKIPGLVSSDTP
jgi:hypothetical protein